MSDKSLEKLIAQLKSEAIDSAERESQKIVDKAEAKAQTIIKNAKEKRERMLSEAAKEAQHTILKGEIALQQAARDLKVTVKNDLLKLFEAVFEKEIEKAFTPDLIKTIILMIVDNLGSDVKFKLPQNAQQELVDAIHMQLNESGHSIEIIKDKTILSGLLITKTDQGWSYQITPKEISELLNGYLSEKFIHILDS